MVCRDVAALIFVPGIQATCNVGNLWASIFNLYAQWCNVRNGCPAKLLINGQIFSPCQTRSDGVPCSNQSVATILFNELTIPFGTRGLSAASDARKPVSRSVRHRWHCRLSAEYRAAKRAGHRIGRGTIPVSEGCSAGSRVSASINSLSRLTCVVPLYLLTSLKQAARKRLVP